MGYLPEVHNGLIVARSKRSRVKRSVPKAKKVKKKVRAQNSKVKARKVWKEWYESTDFIRHMS